MIRERTEKNRQGVPILMHIPLLGGLFGRTVTASQRSELITVITPHIIEPGEQIAYKGSGLIKDPPIPLAAPDDR